MPTNEFAGHLWDVLSQEADYNKRITELIEKFDNEIHDRVTILANSGDGIYLTDHGPKHIRAVFEQASKLCEQGDISLTPYEAFIVAIGIHLHDIGNALGRRGHTESIDDIFKLVFGPLGFNTFDSDFATSIASTHGGQIDGSKDTISTLDVEMTFAGKRTRPQLMAAIIRLADELSEARYRADGLGIESGKLPPGSHAYHLYAYGLHTTEIIAKSRMIRLAFWMPAGWFSDEIEKDKSKIYLLDYIFDRTLKTFDEAIYCTKYMHGSLFFDKVHVSIDVVDKRTKRSKKRIEYTLRQHGFPVRGPNGSDIYELAPELDNYDGNGRLTGEALALGFKQDTGAGA